MIRPMASRLSNQILDEATSWFVEFSAGNLSSLQRRDFIAWLRASPEHVRAYLQITAHWEEVQCLGKKSTHGIDDLIALARNSTAEVIPLVPEEADRDSSSQYDRSRLRRRTDRKITRWLTLAASLVAISAGVGYWVTIERNTYSTETGEQRSVTLADGTTVELNAQSKIRVSFKAHQRDIDLISGQALFHVAKDPARPLIVRTDSTQVRAVGTQFDVYRKEQGTTVTVLEGTVAVVAAAKANHSFGMSGGISATGIPGQHVTEVAPAVRQLVASASPGEMYLSAGDQAVVSARGAFAPRHLADTTVATAWTHKQIVLQNTPLKQVVGEFNRYNTKPLVIIDASVESIRISGIFSSSNPQSLLRGLESLGKFTIRETPDRVEISAK
jgi:transmembrane sensor